VQRAAPSKYLPVRRSSEAEHRSFQFYICHASQNAHDLADRRFWLEFVPRLAMFEDAIYYAMLTVAYITEYPTKSVRPLAPVPDTELGRARYSQAWTWYGNSLKAMYTNHNAPLNVLSCIMYARIEMLQGRGLKGLDCLHRAFSLNKGQESATNGELDILDSTLPILAKTMLPLGNFGRYISEDQRQRTRRNRTKSSTVIDFMIEIYDLVYQVQILYNSPGESQAFRNDRATVIGRLLEWKAAIDSRLAHGTDNTSRHTLAQLLILYHTQYIRVCTTPITQEAIYDAFEADFAEIIAESRIALGSGMKVASETTYDMAIVPCLYFTAWACRHTKIRRQAISLLRTSAPRCEHLWTMPGTVGTLETLAEYEDRMAERSNVEGICHVQSRIPVPETVAQSQVPTEVITRLQRQSITSRHNTETS
jgi:hypothetical protein